MTTMPAASLDRVPALAINEPVIIPEEKVEQLFQQRFTENATNIDKQFAYIMGVQWLFGILMAIVVSPLAWDGAKSTVHSHVYAAVFLGGAIAAGPILLALLRPGKTVTRHVIAVAQMLFGALLIHLTGGRIETHFHVFGSLAFLAFYRDWRVLVTGTLIVVVDHALRNFLWPESIFGLANTAPWRFLEHAGWVIFEDIFLTLACLRGVKEMRAIARSDVQMSFYSTGLEDLVALRTDQSNKILSLVNEGLFLMNRNLEIETPYSHSLEEIFAQKKLGGSRFPDVLSKILPPKTYTTAKDYFALLFDKSVPDKLITKINPLKEVEVSFDTGNGQLRSKYFEIRFARVLANNEPNQVLVTVNDVTARVTLARELQESNKKSASQFEMLFGILHIEPKLLREFMDTTEQDLQRVLKILKEESEDHTSDGARQHRYRDQLARIFRLMHNIKGNANLMKIYLFSNHAHACEEKISAVQRKSDILGNDFLTITVDLKEMLKNLDEVRQLLSRFGDLSQSFRTATPVTANAAAPQDPDSLMYSYMNTMLTELCDRLGKKAKFEIVNSRLSSMKSEDQQLLRKVLLQVGRNALVHGIETPEERAAIGKSETGTITLLFNESPDVDQVSFMIYDDGRGLDFAKLRDKAVRVLGDAKKAASMDDEEVGDLIFMPGVSTVEVVTVDAGRGVGLDAVRTGIRERGGEIVVGSETGRYTAFSVALPL
ncbi:MAG: ATP-binding protein [Candidatus Methylacidiphilales bacterium]|nr:ATP-binding protein [Candidatus Methylacidiphilales bacterium]